VDPSGTARALGTEESLRNQTRGNADAEGNGKADAEQEREAEGEKVVGNAPALAACQAGEALRSSSSPFFAIALTDVASSTRSLSSLYSTSTSPRLFAS
jgi:hypothetical protein